MDLERYFEPAGTGPLVLYDERIESLTGKFVRFKVEGATVVLVGTGMKPAKSNPRRYRLYGYVIDIGEPDTPPRGWRDIREEVDPKIVEQLDRRLRLGALDLLLVRYRRAGATGAIALLVTAYAPIELKSLPSASTSLPVVSLRSGRDAHKLEGKSVLVVGAGAVGSFICENLVRAGLGQLAIRDGDIVRPGNAVRHVLPSTFAGYPKVEALQRLLSQRSYCVTDIASEARHLTDRTEIPDLLAKFDLVIDATADGMASAMLADAARTFGVHIISAALQDEGRVVRVDVVPPLSGEAIGEVGIPSRREHDFFEAGCGDPVSMTPPYAAMEAAAIATRVAVRILTDLQTEPAGVIRVYSL
ncbi:HesA/MoeB/ThiF family protein [Microbacterium sp. 1P10AE]|uniref:HesA/MoeB/ThiF family protein n=1 Tax=Microbacterium sp. 1P10AE TaxID=3132286 RepID=UPI0039A083A0